MSLIPHFAAPHSRTAVSYSNTPIYGFTTCTQHHRVMVYSSTQLALNMSLWLYSRVSEGTQYWGTEGILCRVVKLKIVAKGRVSGNISPRLITSSYNG